MSSKNNHRARSHRRKHLKRSAFGNMARKAYFRDSGNSAGMPLIYRLQRFKQKILESRKEAVEAKNEKELRIP